MAEVPYIDEEWRVIDEAPHYAVSDLGRVQRLTPSHKQAGIINGAPNHNGYLHCTLYVDGGRRFTRKISRLVCEAFHGAKPTPCHQVRHLDGNKLNNRADNLAWGTQLENAADSKRHGSQVCGERVTLAKLTEDQVRYIRSCDKSNRTLGEEFGVSFNTIYEIRRGNLWRHLLEGAEA